MGNDPVNLVDPSGEDTVVVLVGRPLSFGYGHAYIIVKDTETNEIRIISAGPNGDYGSSNAIMNGTVDGTNITGGIFEPGRGGDDPRVEGTEIIDSFNVKGGTMENVINSTEKYIEALR